MRDTSETTPESSDRSRGRGDRTARLRRRVAALLGVLTLAVVALVAAPAPPPAPADAASTIALHGTSTHAFRATRTIWLAAPAGARAGDVLVASLGVERKHHTGRPALIAPRGWSRISRTHGPSGMALVVYVHVFTTTDTAYRWTSHRAVRGDVSVSAFAGVDRTHPAAVSRGRHVADAWTVSTPSLAAPGASALVASYFGRGARERTTRWAAPKGMRALGHRPATRHTSLFLAYAAQPASGRTGHKVAVTSRVQRYAIGVLTVLRAAASTPVPPVTSQPPVPPVSSGTPTPPVTSQPPVPPVSSGTPTPPVTSQPPVPPVSSATPLIFDTDMFSSADDAGALAIAFALQAKGEANLLAINLNTRTDRPLVAKESLGCAVAIARFYGARGLTIGSDGPANGTDVSPTDWATSCADKTTEPVPQPADAVNVYRRTLASQPDHSVVIVCTGFMENLSALLASPPDSVSSLSGRDLVRAKVRELMIMAGHFPSGAGETNIVGNVAAAQTVATQWPTRMVWAGSEAGDAVHTGDTVSRVHPPDSPVRAAYEKFVGPNNWILSDDLLALYVAVRPDDPAFGLVGPGTTVVDNSGGTTFAAGNGHQFYVEVKDTASLDASIESLLDMLPAPTSGAGG